MSLSMFLPFPLIYCPSRHQTQSVRAWLCSDPSVECRLLQSGNSLLYCSSHSCFFDSLIMLPSIRAQPPRNLRRSRNSLRGKGTAPRFNQIAAATQLSNYVDGGEPAIFKLGHFLSFVFHRERKLLVHHGMVF